MALITCDIGLYIPVFPTVLYSVVAHESMQVTLLLSTFSPKSSGGTDRYPRSYWEQIPRLWNICHERDINTDRHVIALTASGDNMNLPSLQIFLGATKSTLV